MRAAAAACALVLALAACGEEKKPEPASEAPASPNALLGRLPPPAAAPSSAGLDWTAPAAWKRSEPASAMRLAQWDVAADADGDPVQCIVFGSIGGSDEDHISRWTLELGPGAKADAKVTHSVNGRVTVTRLAARGSYTDSMRPGEPKPIEDASMLAAIVEGPGGKVHVRLVGPAALVDAAAPQFDEFLASMRVK